MSHFTSPGLNHVRSLQASSLIFARGRLFIDLGNLQEVPSKPLAARVRPVSSASSTLPTEGDGVFKHSTARLELDTRVPADSRGWKYGEQQGLGWAGQEGGWRKELLGRIRAHTLC